MPAVKRPCIQCKEKHVKCDEERPKCRRCQIKDIPCWRPAKRTVFRDGSAASFSRDQKWVSSEAKQFRFHSRGESVAAREPLSPLQTASPSWSQHTQLSPASVVGDSPMTAEVEQALDTTDEAAFIPTLPPSDSHGSGHSPQISPAKKYTNNSHPNLPSINQITPNLHDAYRTRRIPLPPGFSRPSSAGQPSTAPLAPSEEDCNRSFPLENVQEACLLRYWIEEISHWFDLCDESRHFHLVVPTVARHHPHLLNAVFAVAARHLSRLPQYKTQHGILYHGQFLPHLDEHSAVEYMLQCMPALRQFHDVRDDDCRDSIVATAVILRQLEEIDHEDDHIQLYGQTAGVPSGAGKKVNFLAIIDAVLRSTPSQSVFGRRSLMQAAYWMALRQEIYHSFTHMEAPKLILPAEFWHSASPANKTVMHLAEVAKWKWADSSSVEWARLVEQQDYVEKNILADIRPIYKKPADKTRGEIFPTVWYRSNIEVTTMQFSLLAKSVLVAENPQLKLYSASRSSWRLVENEVRLLLLEQSGIALCNPASPPALVHAAFGIQVYGEFFTDQYERRAIRTVVEKYRDTHAWPVQRLLDMFQ